MKRNIVPIVSQIAGVILIVAACSAPLRGQPAEEAMLPAFGGFALAILGFAAGQIDKD